MIKHNREVISFNSLPTFFPHSIPPSLSLSPIAPPSCVPASLRPCVPASLRPCVPASLRPCVPASLRPCVPASLRPCVPASLRPCVRSGPVRSGPVRSGPVPPSLHLSLRTNIALLPLTWVYLKAESFPLFEAMYTECRVSRQTGVDDPQSVSPPAAVHLSRCIAVKQDGRVVGKHALGSVEEDDGRDGAERPTRCLDLKLTTETRVQNKMSSASEYKHVNMSRDSEKDQQHLLYTF